MNTTHIHVHIPVTNQKEVQNPLDPIHIHISDKGETNRQTPLNPLHIYIHLENKTNFIEKWAEKFKVFIDKEEQELK